MVSGGPFSRRCPLYWHDGIPSRLSGTASSGKSYLTSSLRCIETLFVHDSSRRSFLPKQKVSFLQPPITDPFLRSVLCESHRALASLFTNDGDSPAAPGCLSFRRTQCSTDPVELGQMHVKGLLQVCSPPPLIHLNCADDFLRWPAIIGIIVASVVVISILICCVRCLCCGISCFDCFRGRGRKRSKYADAPSGFMPAPYQGYQPANGPHSYAPPQYAQFEVGRSRNATGGKVNEDSLPSMPSWDTATNRQVMEESHDQDVEMGKIDPQKAPMLAHQAPAPTGSHSELESPAKSLPYSQPGVAQSDFIGNHYGHTAPLHGTSYGQSSPNAPYSPDDYARHQSLLLNRLIRLTNRLRVPGTNRHRRTVHSRRGRPFIPTRRTELRHRMPCRQDGGPLRARGRMYERTNFEVILRLQIMVGKVLLGHIFLSPLREQLLGKNQWACCSRICNVVALFKIFDIVRCSR